MKWKDAIALILANHGGSLRTEAIADRIIESRLRTSIGATPSATVGSNLFCDIRDNDDSDFEKVAPATFRVKSDRVDTILARLGRFLPATPTQTNAENRSTDDEQEESDDLAAGVVKALGMYWSRPNVVWASNVRLLGRQGVSAETIDLSNQNGVYLLHDRREVIYVGRAIAESLGSRLYQHTRDRHAGRWDRFSWFGVRTINEDGSFQDVRRDFGINDVVTAFEAILIEALEPRQNRRRGDAFTAIEYLQVEDPDFEAKRNKALLQSIAENLSNSP